MAELIYPPPKKPQQVHFFEAQSGPHMMVVDGSQIYAADSSIRADIEQHAHSRAKLVDLGLVEPFPKINSVATSDIPVRAISLAVAQTCNLGCSYCYADGGDFGGVQQQMPWQVAKQSVDEIVQESKGKAQDIMIAFLGGEPLVNRKLIRKVAEYATTTARLNGLGVGFSITTNGTLIREEDLKLFSDYKFVVTVSMDGDATDHNKVRQYKGGGDTYQKILSNLHPVLGKNPSSFSARVSVTPDNLSLSRYVEELTSVGFADVGFSPVVHSANGNAELANSAIDEYLEALITCAERCKQKTLAGEYYGFANFHAAMAEIHKGTHRPYPCGAGAGYLGVSADGDYYACHRFVNDEAGLLGNVESGIDHQARDVWLDTRHVHNQGGCSSCWARYLCGGGCHHEVMGKGRANCNMIRSWLSYCLGAYVDVLEGNPDYFANHPG